jgi:polyhydroxybutyrate depolymerase
MKTPLAYRQPVLRQLLAIAIFLGNGIPHLHAAKLPSPALPGTYTLNVKSGGYDWTVHIHIPKDYNPDKKPPLVLAFHGAGGEGKNALDHEGWAAKADKEGFVVVAPTGLPSRPRLSPSFLTNPQVWNSGQLNALSPRTRIDDVAFVVELLDELKERVPYDENRVFATGHSNGGRMTFRLAAEMSERLAAVATVAGMMAVEDPKPKKPLPTLYILGTKDPLVPLEGGEVKLPWGTKRNPPVANFLGKWAAALMCETQPATISEADGVKRVEYVSKNGGPKLTVLYLENHGHHWPGSKPLLPESRIGPMKSKLNATDTIWEFFESSGRR